MTTFFCCRVIWGWRITYLFLSISPIFQRLNILEDLYAARQQRPQDAPLWLVGMYVVANIFLNSLNLYWFSKMIDSLRRRAEIRQQTHEHDE
jgi:hypothetical protein